MCIRDSNRSVFNDLVESGFRVNLETVELERSLPKGVPLPPPPPPPGLIGMGAGPAPPPRSAAKPAKTKSAQQLAAEAIAGELNGRNRR